MSPEPETVRQRNAQLLPTTVPIRMEENKGTLRRPQQETVLLYCFDVD